MTEIPKITLQFPSLRAFLAEYGERISADGMLLRSEAPPAVGSTVDIEVVVAEGMRLLRGRGEILWSGTVGTGDGQKAVAIQFQELDDASRTLISRIVEQRGREGAELFNLGAVSGPRKARLLDLTVPATIVTEAPAGALVDSVFDLAEPPVETAVDLFSDAAEAPAPARQPAPPVPLLADPEPAAHSDLSDLFGGDEPEMAPARGRTEAFPPSFVEEVEAELEAVGTSDITPSSNRAIDTGELEARLGPPVAEAAFETPAESLVEVSSPPPVEEAPEPDLAPDPAPELVATPAPESVGAIGLEPVVEPESPPEIDLDPDAEIDLQSAAEPAPAVSQEPPALTEESLKVPGAFNAMDSPETVEIPITAPPTPVVETALPPVEMPPVEMPPVEMPPVEMPPLPGPVDDNLLSIPEIKADSPTAEVPAVAEEQVELLSSAESLRGAASRSRHVGTYLLIVLLVGALAVAGYFLLGMVRGGDGAVEPAKEAAVPAAPMPPAPAREVPTEAAATPAETGPEVGEEPALAVPEPTEPAEPAESTEPAEPTEPTVPLTGLDRITWSETDSETILSLVGDGTIASQQVEWVPIAGDQPRLVIKIAGVERPVQPPVLEVGTSQVRRVRTGLQSSGALHVVVDLAASGVSVRDLAIRGSRIEVRLGVE